MKKIYKIMFFIINFMIYFFILKSGPCKRPNLNISGRSACSVCCYNAFPFIELDSAFYAGNGGRQSDVTDKVLAQANEGFLNIQANMNDMFGDPAPGSKKILVINNLKINGQQIANNQNQQITPEGNTLTNNDPIGRTKCIEECEQSSPESAYSADLCINNVKIYDDCAKCCSTLFPQITLDSATYGVGSDIVDVTNQVRNQANEGYINIPANKVTFFGISDPKPGVKKALIIKNLKINDYLLKNFGFPDAFLIPDVSPFIINDQKITRSQCFQNCRNKFLSPEKLLEDDMKNCVNTAKDSFGLKSCCQRYFKGNCPDIAKSKLTWDQRNKLKYANQIAQFWNNKFAQLPIDPKTNQEIDLFKPDASTTDLLSFIKTIIGLALRYDPNTDTFFARLGTNFPDVAQAKTNIVNTLIDASNLQTLASVEDGKNLVNKIAQAYQNLSNIIQKQNQ